LFLLRGVLLASSHAALRIAGEPIVSGLTMVAAGAGHAMGPAAAFVRRPID
jgi:hypothetical protein